MTLVSFTTRKELANAYKLTPKTIGKRLVEIEIKHSKRLTPKEVQKIFDEFGVPDVIVNGK